MIATLASDADNLFVILTAKSLNPRLHLSTRVAEDTSEQKLRRAGADFVFSPYNSTGHRMAQALLKPHVQQFLALGGAPRPVLNVASLLSRLRAERAPEGGG